MPQTPSPQPKAAARWPFMLLITVVGVSHIILIVISAPDWARVIPFCVLLVSVIGMLLVWLRRRKNTPQNPAR
jgi:nicotinamide riboside transporter PnuC